MQAEPGEMSSCPLFSASRKKSSCGPVAPMRGLPETKQQPMVQQQALEQLWRSANEVGLVPPRLDQTTRTTVLRTTISVLWTTCRECLEKNLDDGSSNSNCNDDGCAPQVVTSAAAVPGVDTFRTYFASSTVDRNFGSQSDCIKATILEPVSALLINKSAHPIFFHFL